MAGKIYMARSVLLQMALESGLIQLTRHRAIHDCNRAIDWRVSISIGLWRTDAGTADADVTKESFE